jgi:hypothetical protein
LDLQAAEHPDPIDQSEFRPLRLVEEAMIHNNSFLKHIHAVRDFIQHALYLSFFKAVALLCPFRNATVWFLFRHLREERNRREEMA